MNKEYSEILIDIHAETIALFELASADWIDSHTADFVQDAGKWKCTLSIECKLTGQTFTGQGSDFERDHACSQALLSAISQRYDAGFYGSISDEAEDMRTRLDFVHECDSVEQALNQIDNSRPVADLVLRPMLLEAVQH